MKQQQIYYYTYKIFNKTFSSEKREKIYFLIFVDDKETYT